MARGDPDGGAGFELLLFEDEEEKGEERTRTKVAFYTWKRSFEDLFRKKPSQYYEILKNFLRLVS